MARVWNLIGISYLFQFVSLLIRMNVRYISLYVILLWTIVFDVLLNPFHGATTVWIYLTSNIHCSLINQDGWSTYFCHRRHQQMQSTEKVGTMITKRAGCFCSWAHRTASGNRSNNSNQLHHIFIRKNKKIRIETILRISFSDCARAHCQCGHLIDCCHSEIIKLLERMCTIVGQCNGWIVYDLGQWELV